MMRCTMSMIAGMDWLTRGSAVGGRHRSAAMSCAGREGRTEEENYVGGGRMGKRMERIGGEDWGR